jgi:hypothetical protein
MEHEAQAIQNEVQTAHEFRAVMVHEPLYGLAPEPGGGGPASVGDPSQPRMEVPVEEPPEPGDRTINMTWGIILGGVLLLFLIVAILFYGIGNTYVSQPISTYPLH